MARYKPYDVKQVTLIPVLFSDQILPGSFEYALNEIVDHHIDMHPFEARYKNDETGCLAYDPAILLKIVLFGYYKGIDFQSAIGRSVQAQCPVQSAYSRYPPPFHHDRRLCDPYA